MNYVKVGIACGLTAALAACGSSNSPSDNQATSASPTPGMADMASPARQAIQQGKGTGRVTAIDSKAGTITLDHGPIPEVSWPAMTMAFKAGPEVLEKAKVGDQVDFQVRVNGQKGEVTALSKK